MLLHRRPASPLSKAGGDHLSILGTVSGFRLRATAVPWAIAWSHYARGSSGDH